jgi:lysyl-tRNA synthetase class 2
LAAEQNQPNQQTQQILSEEQQVRRDKLAQLRADGNDPYLITKYRKTHSSGQIKDGFDALENQDVAIAGRMISRRVMGKASFAHILDEF